MIQTTQGTAIGQPKVEGQVRVYYIDGTPHDCWPVDAREMVEAGNYFRTPPEAQQHEHQRNVVDADEAEEAEEVEEVAKPKKATRSRK